jgi:hypothetical protein
MTLNTTNLGASSPLPEGEKSHRIPIERTSTRLRLLPLHMSNVGRVPPTAQRSNFAQ